MERTVKGIVGDVRYSFISSAWYSRERFQFPGGSTWYIVADCQYYSDREGEHYEAVLKEVS
jgi:hypothetical protein